MTSIDQFRPPVLQNVPFLSPLDYESGNAPPDFRSMMLKLKTYKQFYDILIFLYIFLLAINCQHLVRSKM